MPQPTVQPDQGKLNYESNVVNQMNPLQKDIYSVICSIVKNDDFDRMYEDHTIRYGVLNYIAKYSLASNSYLATETSLNHLLGNGFIQDGRLRRGLKSKENGFTYEHPVPCNVIGAEIMKYRNDAGQIAKILNWSDKVTVLTAEENKKFKLQKLTQKMPEGWKFFSDPQFARYFACGICQENPTLEIIMKGQIMR